MSMDTFKHYVVSSIITFLTGFIPALVAQLVAEPSLWTTSSWEAGGVVGVVCGAILVGVRAGLKGFLERPIAAAIGAPMATDQG